MDCWLSVGWYYSNVVLMLLQRLLLRLLLLLLLFPLPPLWLTRVPPSNQMV